MKHSALAAALVSLGFAAAAIAQSSTASSTSSAPGKSSQGASSSTGMNSGTSSGTKSGSGANTGMSSSGTSNSSAKLAGDERKFMENAAKDGMAEVEMGRMAAGKATDPQVKQFAQRMVTDHSKAGDELKQLASSKGVQLPASVDKKHQKESDDMQKKDAKKFDREYMEHMVKEHKKDVSEFDKQARTAKDPDVKAFAAKTLPTLKEHLAMAQQIEATVKGGGRAAHSGSTAGNTGGSASMSNTSVSSGSSGMGGASSNMGSSSGSTSAKSGTNAAGTGGNTKSPGK